MKASTTIFKRILKTVNPNLVPWSHFCQSNLFLFLRHEIMTQKIWKKLTFIFSCDSDLTTTNVRQLVSQSVIQIVKTSLNQ